MYRIMQSPTEVALLYDGAARYRQIYMDGRTLPKDPNPTWLGYSVGRWEGDTLVVESAGFNDRSWLDRAGHPHSESLRVTEGFGGLVLAHSIFKTPSDDPEPQPKPLSISLAVNYAGDRDRREIVCKEGGGNTNRLPPVTNTGVHLTPAVL